MVNSGRYTYLLILSGLTAQKWAEKTLLAISSPGKKGLHRLERDNKHPENGSWEV